MSIVKNLTKKGVIIKLNKIINRLNKYIISKLNVIFFQTVIFFFTLNNRGNINIIIDDAAKYQTSVNLIAIVRLAICSLETLSFNRI